MIKINNDRNIKILVSRQMQIFGISIFIASIHDTLIQRSYREIEYKTFLLISLIHTHVDIQAEGLLVGVTRSCQNVEWIEERRMCTCGTHFPGR